MAWGTYRDEEDRIHVLPLDDEGKFMTPHVASLDCPCHPEVLEDGLITHNEVH